jgi:hypothetical protein
LFQFAEGVDEHPPAKVVGGGDFGVDEGVYEAPSCRRADEGELFRFC